MVSTLTHPEIDGTIDLLDINKLRTEEIRLTRRVQTNDGNIKCKTF